MSSVEELVGQSTRQAEVFVKQYYAALDSALDLRTAKLAPFYSHEARVSWNGNPVAFVELPGFVDALPKSDHAIQAFDCHPIAGSSTDSPPSLVLSVTGQVAHGSRGHPPPGTAPKQPFETLPRVFSQTFILVFQPPAANGSTPQGELTYTIMSDSYRFV